MSRATFWNHEVEELTNEWLMQALETVLNVRDLVEADDPRVQYDDSVTDKEARKAQVLAKYDEDLVEVLGEMRKRRMLH
ncbi:MAG: hypothetical protein ACXWCO_00640 [Caldimonas sp.]